ncbi:MAG: adenosylmethionine--8-amino-7-oxononanoate transaminase [Rhizobiales bacterium]|nr:adenosylmethionine--8-amino-7-oxononanoate transaminase [Hyphomicrobiales bacterium]
MISKFDNYQDWLKFDRDHLWHPYTSMVDPLPCYPVASAKGVHINLADGNTLIDGMSSWWSAIHGYNHPKLNQALVDQTQKMAHVMFGGFAHQPASELGSRLLDMTPDIFQYVFLADSGSISIEVALKMALQYYRSAGKLDKQKFLTVRGGYHGDPFTCMSVGDPENGQHYLFPSTISTHLFVPRPNIKFYDEWDASDISELKLSIEKNHREVAAIIIEPIVQGAGGMHFYHPEYLRQLRALCDEFDILLIFDEIATGFGRTGKLFAMDHAGITPDIFCVGKAMTGGMMTLAATITTKKVAMTISNGDVPILMHGPTFMGNPLACAVASASLDILMDSGEGATYPKGWQHNIQRIENGLQQLKEIADHPAVNDVRVLGAIGVIEMNDPTDVAKIQPEFIAEGVWVRPFGRLIYIMPQYIISENELNSLCNAIKKVILKVY